MFLNIWSWIYVDTLSRSLLIIYGDISNCLSCILCIQSKNGRYGNITHNNTDV